MYTTVQKNTFIQQGCIKLIKSDSKYIYNVTKFLIFLNVLLNFVFIKDCPPVISELFLRETAIPKNSMSVIR